jgi:spoIIIJ-associated protein
MDEHNKKIDLKTARRAAEGLLQKLAPEARIESVSESDGTITISAKVDDPQVFIGQDMETLLAVQHLLRAILRKDSGVSCYIDLDINGYKKKRREYLKELAISTANEVSLVKREMALSPMSAYERRIVHMELSERRDIVTESQGNGTDRRVVVRPA